MTKPVRYAVMDKAGGKFLLVHNQGLDLPHDATEVESAREDLLTTVDFFRSAPVVLATQDQYARWFFAGPENIKKHLETTHPAKLEIPWIAAYFDVIDQAPSSTRQIQQQTTLSLNGEHDGAMSFQPA